MLNDEDINKLTQAFQEVFVTKQDIKELKSDMADLKELIAIQDVLRAEKEPILSGDLRELVKKLQ
jgi:hypothetical protein